MRKAVATKPGKDFNQPDTVVSVTINSATGCPAAPEDLKKHEEFYVIGTEPGDQCDEMEKEDGRSASVPRTQQDSGIHRSEPEQGTLPPEGDAGVR